MHSLLILGLASFIFAILVTPMVRFWARHWNLVDSPDAGRKIHQTSIPRLGGVAVVISYLLAYGTLLIIGLKATSEVKSGFPMVSRLWPAVMTVFALGIIDDVRPIRAWQKFAGQIIAATIVYFAGVHVGGFAGYHLPEWLSLPATIFWIVLCTNAINLIDGVDGLATGVGVFATATTLLAALLQNNIDLALAVAPLLGCLLGFLRYNFNPATIFLGDSGSLVVGFFLGCCSVVWSQKSATILGMTAPLLALSVPLLDTSLAVVRRFLRNQPLFTADRGHIHHRLLDRGWTPRRVALVIYGFSALSAILALCLMNKSFQGAVVVIFCACTWIGIQHLGYVEFGVAGRMFIEGAFRRLLNTNIALKAFEDRLGDATGPDECWNVIRTTAKDFGFHAAEMTFAGRHYQYREEKPADSSWHLQIPLSPADFVALTRSFEADSEHSVVAPYADCLRRLMAPKLAQFRNLSLGDPTTSLLNLNVMINSSTPRVGSFVVAESAGSTPSR